MKRQWTIRLSATAEQDYRQILRWTAETFGRGQARTYARTLASALRDLTHGPAIAGAKIREDICPNIHTLHVARKGHMGRHFVIFRITATGDAPFIDVLRLLHDSMDLPPHLSAGNDPDFPKSMR